MAEIFLALVHHPVVDRNGRIITSAITSLDLHDLARSSRTYGVRAFYVVHPVPEQREFARSVLDHWRIGYGRSFDSRRVEALDLIEVVAGLDEAVAAAERAAGRRPEIVHTSAREAQGMSFAAMRERMAAADAAPVLILLGTGFGVATLSLSAYDRVRPARQGSPPAQAEPQPQASTISSPLSS